MNIHTWHTWLIRQFDRPNPIQIQDSHHHRHDYNFWHEQSQRHHPKDI